MMSAAVEGKPRRGVAWMTFMENTTASHLARPPPSIYEHAPSACPAAWATAIQRSLLPAPPPRSITMCRAPKIWGQGLGLVTLLFSTPNIDVA